VLLEVRIGADGARARHLGVAGVLGVDAAEELWRAQGMVRSGQERSGAVISGHQESSIASNGCRGNQGTIKGPSREIKGDRTCMPASTKTSMKRKVTIPSDEILGKTRMRVATML
jgi:hypothetical protein